MTPKTELQACFVGQLFVQLIVAYKRRNKNMKNIFKMDRGLKNQVHY